MKFIVRNFSYALASAPVVQLLLCSFFAVVNLSAQTFSVVHNFTDGEGYSPFGDLVLSSNSLFGTCSGGGAFGSGTVFTLNRNGSGLTVFPDFAAGDNNASFEATNSDGLWPEGTLLLSNNTLYGTCSSGGAYGCGTIFKVNTDGSGFTVLHTFSAIDWNNGATNADGAVPGKSLVLSGRTLYGMTAGGGISAGGTVFRLNIDGSDFSKLYDLDNNGYNNTGGGLTLAGNELYGATMSGGASGYGSIFKIHTNGTGFAVVHDFSSPAMPEATLLLSGSDFSKLYDLDNNGYNNTGGGLTLAGNELYGATMSGGASGYGSIFKIHTNGTGFAVVHDFSSPAMPEATLLLSGSTLFGTTTGEAPDGSSFGAMVFKVNTDGSGFTNLHTVARSDASLVPLGNTVYGTTVEGGHHDFFDSYGTVFAINTDGAGFTNLYSFTVPDFRTGHNQDGANPAGGLLLSGNMLYGTTTYGGSAVDGTVFVLSLASSPGIPLSIQSLRNKLVLSWSDSTFLLQASPAIGGIYTNVAGAQSPYTNSVTGLQQFFRLVRP